MFMLQILGMVFIGCVLGGLLFDLVDRFDNKYGWNNEINEPEF